MLTFDYNDTPELAENIFHAQAAGHSSVLTYNGGGALRIANRAAATSGIPAILGTTIDEYPFATTSEGGAGTWIGHVPPHQQNVQGGMLSRFYRLHGLRAGDKFSVRVISYRGNEGK